MGRVRQGSKKPQGNAKHSSAYRRVGRDYSTQIKWTPEKRLTLNVAVYVAKKDWTQVPSLWAHFFPEDAARVTSAGRKLRSRLDATWREQFNPQKKSWDGILQSSDDLERHATNLIAQMKRLLANADAPTSSLPTQSPADHIQTSHIQIQMTATTSQTAASSRMTIPITPRSQTAQSSVSGRSPATSTNFTRSRHFVSSLSLLSNRPGMGRSSREQLAARLEATRAMIHGPYRAPLREQAQPPPSTLVYRFYYPDATHVGNLPATKGFIAGYFLSTKGGIATPLPHDAEFLFNAIEHHVNRSNIPSPFISVANDFFWSLRQAIKLSTRDKPLRMSVIDGRQAAGHDGSKAYHLRAYSGQIRERRAYESGGWRPAGMSEFLIWGQIPKEAILADFSVADFLAICNIDPNFAAVFRPQYLKLPGFTHRVRGLMRQDHPVIDEASMSAVCMLLNSVFSIYFPVASSLPEIITKFVSDIVQGWHVKPREELTRTHWLSLASRFAAILKNHLPAASAVPDRTIAKAFLFGVLSGFGEPNWQLDDKLKHKMLANAKAYGLKSPDSMFAAEEDPIRAAIRQFTYENVSPQRRFTAIGPEYEGTMNSGTERWWRTTAMGRQQQHAEESERRRRNAHDGLARQQEQAYDDCSDEEGTDESQEPQETHVPRHGVRWFEAVVIPRMLPTPAASTSGASTRPGNSEDSAITIEDDREEDYRMVEEESEEEDEYDFVEHGEANDMDDDDFVMLDAED
ncbi:hypothetical protein BDZ85DRAFT_28781 [Elsinoe ampelina]|uniref:DUF7587 domain-containing protein n=1 Tax=Elsinoe ampelina TaxID=302913 RepID=A0A6A6G4D5_9PEZI|nr:hypothetical protein BDZ85DRAFT_28781 [Elsinoe ampelina]